MNCCVKGRAQNLTDGSQENTEKEKYGPKNDGQNHSAEYHLPILAVTLPANSKPGNKCDAAQCPADALEKRTKSNDKCADSVSVPIPVNR